MSKKKNRKDKKEKAFSDYRGYPLIPPNKTHGRKKGPYDRKKLLEDLNEEVMQNERPWNSFKKRRKIS